MRKMNDDRKAFPAVAVGWRIESLWPMAWIILLLAVVLSVAGCVATADQDAVNAAKGQKTLTAAPQAAPSKPQAPTSADLAVQELSVREDRGQTTLSIKFTKALNHYRHFPLPQPSRIVIDLLGDVAKGSVQPETFRITTYWVNAFRVESSEAGPRLTIDIAGAKVPEYTISQESGGLKIVLGAYDAKAPLVQDFTLVKDGVRTDVPTSEAGVAARAKQNGGSGVNETDGQSTAKKYSGQKISLDFKDADIKNVFRLLAEVSGLNIVVTNDVNRKITVRLVEVPWDQAMDLIIDTNGLGREQVGNVVRISTAGTLKSEKDALIAANKAQENLEPVNTRYFHINYAKAKDLEVKIKPLMTKRPEAALVVDDRSNTIMVRDIQKTIEDVSTLVSKFDLRTPQILIESNLVETTPTFSRALGLELDSVFNNARIIGASRFLAGAPFSGSPQGITDQLVVPNSGFRFGYFGNNVRGILSAAENEGLVKIISRPSIVTLNNVASTIKSERILRIVLPTSTNIASGSGSAAGGAVATEKIPVGINLTVIPQVSSDGFVLLNIKVKSSSIANSPTVPSGSTVVPFDELNREAEANVLVKDGETIVIGGILKDTDNNTTSGVPYLKDIPVLGWLFKNWRIQKEFEELVVFITPRIAAAGSENLPSAEELWREQMRNTRAGQDVSSMAKP